MTTYQFIERKLHAAAGRIATITLGGVQNLIGLQGDSDQEIKLKHLYHYE